MLKNKFKVIVCVYNSEKWIKKCLFSILNQTYTNYDLIVINDASTDNTFNIIKSIQKDYNFTFLNRSKNTGLLKNTIDGINLICNDDNDIIISIDGDDWLYCCNAFEYLNKIYQDKDIWLTYGQFINLLSKSIGCNKQIKNTKTYRKKERWKTSHLKTFKYHLWKKIADNDLKNKFGEYYSMGVDHSIMFPMVEMAGNKRIKFISKILYIYNNLNNLNCSKKNIKLQLSYAQEIRNKPCYEELL